jgi:indoleamine 2,3-dioxygenase
MNSIATPSALRLEDFAHYQVDPLRGFLPARDPLERLPAAFEAWEYVAADVPALLMSGRLRSTLERMPLLDAQALEDERQRQRAMLLLSMFGNAYVWADDPPAQVIPPPVAAPLCALAGILGRPPVVAHASLVLNNWRRLDRAAPIELDNLAALQLMLGGMDEQWFYLTTVVIEARGAAALMALVEAQQAVERDDESSIARCLERIEAAVRQMRAVLERIPEKCDPYIFFHRVRPYFMGWRAPGVVYEGVSEEPQMLAGGSAAQSALVQALDAALGVAHSDHGTRPFLIEMRRYMSPAHRRFIEAIERGPSLRDFVLAHPALRDVYNACVHALDEFRKGHLEIAVRYISHQAVSPDEAKGTGGTSFVPFLSAARKETRRRVIE